ncbi:MAG: ABC transporter ATP-binding protein [Rhodothermales bacterium]
MNASALAPMPAAAPVPHIHRMTPLVEVTGLEKSFGALRVLDGVDLRLRPGRVTAVVGPNGSGKTTLIKSILGLVRPDGGRVVFDGEEVGRDEAYRRRIGYMPQAARFPENLTAREVLTMLRDLRGNPTATDDDLIGALRLEPELDKPLRTLSGGTRQKVNAAVAFLFRPDLVILDEPTAGLDPVASSALKDKVRAAQATGTTFLLTSHIMSELEELADDVAFLLDGRVRFQGTADELKARGGHDRLERALAHLMTENDR